MGFIMKKIIFILTILFMFSSCERISKRAKHIQSDLVGLNRRVTLFSDNGNIIKVWEGKFRLELVGSTASWIDADNKEVKISGTFIIEEL